MASAWGCWVRETTAHPRDVGRSAQRVAATRPLGYVSLMAYNLAVQAQPNAIDKDVFLGHYLHGCSNVKAEAARLGVSRTHYYRLLNAFSARVHHSAQQIALQIGHQGRGQP